MTRTIVLLRGVNVSGANKVPMEDLRTALSRAGFGRVATYIQSGNIAVDSELEPHKVASRVADIVNDHFDVCVPTMAIHQTGIESIEKSAPFPNDCDPATHLIYFPEGSVDVTGIEAMDDTKYPGDTISASTSAVYVAYGSGQSGSKLTVNALEKAAKTNLTGRNLRSVAKLTTL